mgnify:CR=1 FL=1
MKKKNIKIVVVPHYSGSVKTSEVFKRIISEQIEKKLSKKYPCRKVQKARILYLKKTCKARAADV